MEQNANPPLPGVIYATLVGVNVTTDDMLLEFWESRAGVSSPAIPSEEIVKAKAPVARIAIPFNQARWLRDNLTKLMASQEELRKTGQ